VYERVDDEDCDCFCFQGVEFFDEKLNALFMAWLLDHGTELLLGIVFVHFRTDKECVMMFVF